MVVYLKKQITVIIAVVIFAVIFQSPLVKAQEEDTFFTFQANMKPQEIPNSLSTESVNLADTNNITTEIDRWSMDMGADVIDGSYVGALFEPSIFELDYKPLSVNDWYMMDTRIGWADPYQSFPPSNTNPIYLSDPEPYDYDATFSYAKSRSYISLTQIANFSNRVIMSGATELWIKIPALSKCLNFDEMTPTIAIFKTTEDNITIQSNLENGNLWYEPSFSLYYQMYPYKWAVYENGTPYDKEIIAGSIREDFTSKEGLLPRYNGELPYIYQPIIPEHIIGNNMYSHIYGTIEPNVNYIVCFTGILSQKPEIYLTEEDIHSNSRNSIIQVGDIVFDEPDPFIISDPQDIYEFTAWHRWASLLQVNANTTVPLINETMILPVDLAFSFVFQSGRGEQGMFGTKLHFDEQDSLVFYNRMDIPSSNQFLSVMLPFISERDIEIDITATLLAPNIKFEPQGVLSESSDTFVYTNPYVWYSGTSLRYSDYILFTIPYKINVNTITEPYVDVKIMITFIRSTDITFLFSTLEDTTTGWFSNQVIEPNPNLIDMYIGSPDPYFPYVPFNHPRYDLTYTYNKVNKSQMALFTYTTKAGYETLSDGFNEYYILNYKTPLDLNNHTVLHYKLFRSVQFTDGIWSEYSVDSEGVGYATHFFERRVAIGRLDLWVDTSNNESNEQQSWFDPSVGYYTHAFELLTEGKILESFAYSVAGQISLLYNGASELWGVITGVFSKVWDTIKGFGNWLKTTLLSWIGEVLSIFGDIGKGVEDLIEISLYVIAMVIFMYLLAWAGKLIYIGRFNL